MHDIYIYVVAAAHVWQYPRKKLLNIIIITYYYAQEVLVSLKGHNFLLPLQFDPFLRWSQKFLALESDPETFKEIIRHVWASLENCKVQLR